MADENYEITVAGNLASMGFFNNLDCKLQAYKAEGCKVEGGLHFRNIYKNSLPNKPLVTVITVVFNGEKTLHDTINSVRMQSYDNIEHIIVDGGSSDATVTILRQYEHIIDYWISEQDAGIYDAMNKGIAKATGDIIGFLNADDLYNSNDAVEKVVDAFLSKQYQAVFADLLYVNTHNLNHIVRKYSSKKFAPHRLAYGWMPAHPTLYLRKEIFEQYGVFKTDYQISGDYELVARLFYKYKVSYKYLPMDMVKMRIGGISTRGWRNNILLNKEILRACDENGIRTNIFKIYSKYPQKLCEFF
jgi:glycosyltransferase involved in cell wall biosynthesis